MNALFVFPLREFLKIMYNAYISHISDTQLVAMTCQECNNVPAKDK